MTRSGESNFPFLNRTARMRDQKGLVSDYELKRPISNGGEGDVYYATPESAIKIYDGLLTERQIGRQALIAASLGDHPHIPTVYNYGEALLFQREPSSERIGSRTTRQALATEYIDGPTLQRFGIDKSIPPSEAVRITIGLAEILRDVHSQGIVHLDVKGKNVLVDAQMQPKLIDFGVADTIDELPAGPRAGTLTHAPREQWEEGKRTAAMDIHALGVLLHELLTQSLPAKGIAMKELIADRNRIYPSQVSSIIANLQSLVDSSRSHDPHQRPDINTFIGELNSVLTAHGYNTPESRKKAPSRTSPAKDGNTTKVHDGRTRHYTKQPSPQTPSSDKRAPNRPDVPVAGNQRRAKQPKSTATPRRRPNPLITPPKNAPGPSSFQNRGRKLPEVPSRSAPEQERPKKGISRRKLLASSAVLAVAGATFKEREFLIGLAQDDRAKPEVRKPVIESVDKRVSPEVRKPFIDTINELLKHTNEEQLLKSPYSTASLIDYHPELGEKLLQGYTGEFSFPALNTISLASVEQPSLGRALLSKFYDGHPFRDLAIQKIGPTLASFDKEQVENLRDQAPNDSATEYILKFALNPNAGFDRIISSDDMQPEKRLWYTRCLSPILAKMDPDRLIEAVSENHKRVHESIFQFNGFYQFVIDSAHFDAAYHLIPHFPDKALQLTNDMTNVVSRHSQLTQIAMRFLPEHPEKAISMIDKYKDILNGPLQIALAPYHDRPVAVQRPEDPELIGAWVDFSRNPEDPRLKKKALTLFDTLPSNHKVMTGPNIALGLVSGHKTA